MKIFTKDLIGRDLDWAVERANGTFWSANGYFIFRHAGCGPNGYASSAPQWRYSTDWSQGGPILERERIWVCAHSRGGWFAEMRGRSEGPTPLIAAMRCYVALKLDHEVYVPKERL